MLIIDCGTTNLRVFLIEDGQECLCARRDGGVRHTAIDGDNRHLRAALKEALLEIAEKAGRPLEALGPCIAYGMITSDMGLYELPHLPAPVGCRELHDGMREAHFPEILPMPISFIPGVRNFSGPVNLDNYSGMDMMRGEETESIGLHALLAPETESLLVLPGSHNKLVHMDAEGQILGCMTSISGELLDAVSRHTILADAVKGSFAEAATLDLDMVREGAQEAQTSGLGRACFAGRILRMLGKEEPERIQSFLLGAVLSQDVQALRRFDPQERCPVYVAGKEVLQEAMLALLGEGRAVRVCPQVSAKMGWYGAVRIGEGGKR